MFLLYDILIELVFVALPYPGLLGVHISSTSGRWGDSLVEVRELDQYHALD